MFMKKKVQSEREKIFTWQFVVVMLVCIVATVIIFNFIIQISFVFGSSMSPTMETGNLVLSSRLDDEYERMDIVTAKVNGKILIKRVIGLPGETIQIIDGYVYINGEMLEDVFDEPMSMKNVYHAVKELTLGEDEYFLIGDNRNASTDSRAREVGPIKKEDITSKVICGIIPPKKIN